MNFRRNESMTLQDRSTVSSRPFVFIELMITLLSRYQQVIYLVDSHMRMGCLYLSTSYIIYVRYSTKEIKKLFLQSSFILVWNNNCHFLATSELHDAILLDAVL